LTLLFPPPLLASTVFLK
jgi:hypothetical protein